MRARSWMAVLALIAAASIAAGRAMQAESATEAQAQEQAPRRDTQGASSKTTDNKGTVARSTTPVIPVVHLNLRIAGLGREGCEVEVKPGNASCKFGVRNVTENGEVFEKGAEGPQHVPPTGYAYVDLRDLELRGADRVLTVAVTVREPGQAPKTIFRGFRVPLKDDAGASKNAATVPVFTCFLNAASKIARLDGAPAARK
jgi:Ni/Co efflux regulator RcnB